MTEEEYREKVKSGEIEEVEEEEEIETPPPATGGPYPTAPTVDDYLTFLETLRRIKQHGSSVPTYTPKSFLEQFYLYESGSTRKLYVWINGTWVDTSGVSDHGALSGLADDDHSQYHNDARGDARYYIKAAVDALIPPKTDTKQYEAGEDLAIRVLCSRGHETTINGETVLRDSYVSEITGEADTNFGDNAIMRVEQDAISHFTKGLVWFDITSLPAGADVYSVKLKLYVSNVNNLGGGDYLTLGTKRVTATWVENVITWNNKPGEGADYGTVNVNSVGWIEVDITDLYKEWKAGTYANYGVWIYGSGWSVTDLPAYADFNSKEAGSNNPYLYITYRGDKTKVYKAKATNWMGMFLAGFNTSAKSQGETATIQSSGSLDGFSLTESSTYYASNTPGAISTSKGTVEKKIGKALSSSVLLILLGEAIKGYKAGVSSRGAATADGSVNYPHGLGTTPTRVKITALCGDEDNNNESVGIYDGSVVKTVGVGINGTFTDTTYIVRIEYTNVGYWVKATISVNATNITLAWTKAVANAADTIHLLWEAWAD